MLHGCASPLMFEAASCGPRFTISLKRSHLTARQPQRPAPIPHLTCPAMQSGLRVSSFSGGTVLLSSPNGYAVARATVRQKKTGRPVRFELTEHTRQAVDTYLKAAGKKPGEFLFTSRRRPKEGMTTRQYARLVSEWVAGIGLDASVFGTH